MFQTMLYLHSTLEISFLHRSSPGTFYNKNDILDWPKLLIRMRSHVRFVRNPQGLLHFYCMVTWSALRCVASGESGKKVVTDPMSKTAAAAAKRWFDKLPLYYTQHSTFPWKQCGRRSAMWPPYSLRWNLSAATCRPCDRSLTLPFH